MKKSDLSPERRALLVPVDEYPGAHALVPPPPPRWLKANRASEVLFAANKAIEALRSAAAKLSNPLLLCRTLDRREAVISSQIEGTHSNVDQLLSYEATGSANGMPSDVVVTHNYLKALQTGMQMVSDGSGFTEELVSVLHKTLMEGATDYFEIPGEIRKKQNWIGGYSIYEARFVPPPAEYVPEHLQLLREYLNDKEGDNPVMLTPLTVRLAVAHAHFETIHPFPDGNGRVGRLLLPLMMAEEGLPPIYLAGYMKANQRAYYDALLGVQLKDEWDNWLHFMGQAVTASVSEALNMAKEINTFVSDWKEANQTLGLRSDSVAHKLPEYFASKPAASARQIEAELGVSFPAVNKALGQAVKMGMLESPESQRNRVFIARRLVDVLNKPAIPERYQ